MIRNGDANFVAREPNVRSDLALLSKPLAEPRPERRVDLTGHEAVSR